MLCTIKSFNNIPTKTKKMVKEVASFERLLNKTARLRKLKFIFARCSLIFALLFCVGVKSRRFSTIEYSGKI